MDLKQVLRNLQNECNILYEEYGATDDVIQLQVAINSFRHSFNIPDEENMTDSNKGFVQ